MSAPLEPVALIRPAKVGDIPQVHAIYVYFVLHTITDLYHEPPTLASFTEDYENLVSRGQPYFVAVESPESQITSSDGSKAADTERVLGFIHAFPFRGYKIGYVHTVELCIICHPDEIRRGIGSALMKTFLDALESDGKFEQVLAFMTVLEEEEEDRRVKEFYEKWGFREVGKLEGVGQKFGKRISKRWMQRAVYIATVA